MPKSVLVFAAHPDDEVLGCGGTIAKFADEGSKIHISFLADGVSSRRGLSAGYQKEVHFRRSAAKLSCEILGVSSVSFGEYPDNRMDTVALLDIVQTIETLIFKHEPDIVFTHHGGDLNIDHRRVHQAVVTACRPQVRASTKCLLSFEVPSSTEWQSPSGRDAFTPNWFVDISDTLERKLAALDAYSAEMRPWPHPRSRQAIEHLARWRGATVGVNAAEAFLLARRVE